MFKTWYMFPLMWL